MKTFKIILLVLLFSFYSTELYSQQQVKILWPSLADSPWPTLRGDMQGTGRSEYIGPRTNNVIWKKDMPLGVIYGPLIGYDNNLYMGERALSLNTVNYFYSLDKNGNDNWIFETETNFANNVGPLLGNDSTIYFGSRNSNIYSLDFYGNKKWNISGFSIGVLNFTLSIDRTGNLYVPAHDTIFVISPNGNPVRKIPWDGIYLRGIVFSPLGDTMYFKDEMKQVGWAGSLKSTDLDGNINWSFNAGGYMNWGLPAVDNQNNVYVIAGDTILYKRYLYALTSAGQIKWKYEILHANQYSSPAIDANGNIIFSAYIFKDGKQKSAIISLDYYGNENWTTILDFNNDLFQNYLDHELVCDAEGKVYFGTSIASYFGCIDSDGTILWTLDMGDLEYDSCPAIGSDGTLYIGAHISSTFPYHTQNLIAVKDSPTVVEDYRTVPDYSLYQNYPNPFNPSTTISWQSPVSSLQTLKIYDVLGNEVATLVNEFRNAGSYEFDFDASELSSGVYFYKLQVGDFVQTKKMLLMK
jgi:hypothetical protein